MKSLTSVSGRYPMATVKPPAIFPPSKYQHWSRFHRHHLWYRHWLYSKSPRAQRPSLLQRNVRLSQTAPKPEDSECYYTDRERCCSEYHSKPRSFQVDIYITKFTSLGKISRLLRTRKQRYGALSRIFRVYKVSRTHSDLQAWFWDRGKVAGYTDARIFMSREDMRSPRWFGNCRIILGRKWVIYSVWETFRGYEAHCCMRYSELNDSWIELSIMKWWWWSLKLRYGIINS